MTRRVYPKPPIVEAVISLHFQAPVDTKIALDALTESLGHRYDASQIQAADLVQASFRAESDGAVSASARRVPHMVYLASAGGLRLLGCGVGVLAVHTLAPYPGWESFIDQAQEAVDALPAVVRDSPLTRVGLRYIDLIRLPPEQGYEDFLTLMPKRPPALPPFLSNYHQLIQSHDPDDGTVAQLMIVNTTVPDHEGVALLYDLSLYRAGDPLTPFADDQWRAHAEALHLRLRDIFEASITDDTRALFQ